MGIGEIFNEFFTGLGGLLVFYLVFYGFCLLAGITLYILNAVGLYEMGKSFSVKAPWLSFIPVASSFAIGRIAQEYVKKNGKKSAKFSVILLLLNILTIILTTAFFIVLAISIINAVDIYNSGATPETAEAISIFLTPIALYFGAVAIGIAFNVTYYVCIWRVFAIFEKCNATLYLVLSIFFSFLYPIFIFILRKKRPEVFSLQENNEII